MTAAAPARRRLLADAPALVALVLLWLCLWGSIAPLTVVTGLVTALVVTRVFELPPLPAPGRLHPVAAVVLVARLLADIVAASVQVAAQAVRAAAARRPPTTALVRVPLRVHDDLMITLTAVALSLVPGSLVVEVDRDAAVLYLHVLGVRDTGDAARSRRQVQALERRIVRAIGSRTDRAADR